MLLLRAEGQTFCLAIRNVRHGFTTGRSNLWMMQGNAKAPGYSSHFLVFSKNIVTVLVTLLPKLILLFLFTFTQRKWWKKRRKQLKSQRNQKQSCSLCQQEHTWTRQWYPFYFKASPPCRRTGKLSCDFCQKWFSKLVTLKITCQAPMQVFLLLNAGINVQTERGVRAQVWQLFLCPLSGDFDHKC